MFLKIEIASNSLTSNPQNSIQAITTAIQAVFSTPSSKTSKQSSK